MASQNTQSITQGSSLDGPATPTKESPSKFVNSPNAKGASTPEQQSTTAGVQPLPSSLSATKPKPKFKERKLDANGNKRNFYNPPGKVMRHLAQQSYYDNFYGNQGQFFTLKQKFKTQMCKHFLDDGECPLAQYCQFAHGPEELRQPNDVSIFCIFFLKFIFDFSLSQNTLEKQHLVQFTLTTRPSHVKTGLRQENASLVMDAHSTITTKREEDLSIHSQIFLKESLFHQCQKR